MALITGTPLGVVTTQDSEIYIDSAPYIFYQEKCSGVNPLNNPDSDSFYWGLTGSAACPVYQFECYDTVQWASAYETNSIRCDTTGDQGQIQKLNYLDLTFNLKTFFPSEFMSTVMRGGAVTTNSGATQKFGIGQPNNTKFYRVYFPVVYDPDTGDYISVTMHRAQFVEAWSMSFVYGQPATLGVTIRGFADSTLPADQLFATVIRADPSAIS